MTSQVLEKDERLFEELTNGLCAIVPVLESVHDDHTSTEPYCNSECHIIQQTADCHS